MSYIVDDMAYQMFFEKYLDKPAVSAALAYTSTVDLDAFERVSEKRARKGISGTIVLKVWAQSIIWCYTVSDGGHLEVFPVFKGTSQCKRLKACALGDRVRVRFAVSKNGRWRVADLQRD